MKIRLCHLYPDLLDLYSDGGNLIALNARARWRGIETEVRKISLGEPLKWSEVDILLIGGGSEREQYIVVEDLMKRAEEIKAAIDDGLVILSICSGYQLLGQYYQKESGEKVPGLGILDTWTIANEKRLIGNVVINLNEEINAPTNHLKTVVGFENHSGKTYLGRDVQPLGNVIQGYGNNGEDGSEGVRYKNVFGSYLHGPLLPKNPHIADRLLQLALERKGYNELLDPIDDSIEELAHRSVVDRVISKI